MLLSILLEVAIANRPRADSFGLYAHDFHGPNASTVLLHLDSKMAIPNIAYGLDIGESPSPKEKDDDDDEKDHDVPEMV